MVLTAAACRVHLPGFWANGEPDVLQVQMPREEGKKQRDTKGFVPSLKPIILAATNEIGMSMSMSQLSAEEQLYSCLANIYLTSSLWRER